MDDIRVSVKLVPCTKGQHPIPAIRLAATSKDTLRVTVRISERPFQSILRIIGDTIGKVFFWTLHFLSFAFFFEFCALTFYRISFYGHYLLKVGPQRRKSKEVSFIRIRIAKITRWFLVLTPGRSCPTSKVRMCLHWLEKRIPIPDIIRHTMQITAW